MMDTTDKTAFAASRRGEFFFWGCAITVLFAFLGHNALWASEDRWAEITREMILTGDYLHPAINWQVYFDKPQLSYWVILPFAWMFGTIDELVARIPSALAALAGLYGTILLGKQLFGRRLALLAGWILLGCYGFLFWGRTAAADMANLAAIILAVAFFFKVEAKAGFWSYLLFYLICFAGALTKGLPALVMPLAVVAPWLLLQNRWKKHLKVSNFLALAIASAAYFTPFYLAAVTPLAPGQALPAGEPTTGLALVWRENVVRVFQPFDHKDPFFSYLYNLPRVMLPWAPVFLVALAALIRNWKRLPEKMRAVLLGAGLMFLLYTLSGSRRWYYILPLMPFCALVTAGGLNPVWGEEKWLSLLMRLMRYLAIIAGSLGVASLVALPLWKLFIKVSPPGLLLVSLPVAGLLVLIVMLMDNQEGAPLERISGLPRAYAATVISVAILVATVFDCVIPSFTVFRTEKPFCQSLRGDLVGIAPESMLFWRYEANAKLLFYMGLNGPVATAEAREFQGAVDELAAFLAKNRGRRVAILCYNKPKVLDELGEAAKILQLPIDPAQPSFIEPTTAGGNPKSRKQAVWVLDVPANE